MSYQSVSVPFNMTQQCLFVIDIFIHTFVIKKEYFEKMNETAKCRVKQVIQFKDMIHLMTVESLTLLLQACKAIE